MISCQHCQTWILDDHHRCHRCGRRVRNTPFRPAAGVYPAKTANAYAFDSEPVSQAPPQELGAISGKEQKLRLPNGAAGPRVIPFPSLANQAERESIRARAADLARPAPLKTETVQGRHVRPFRAVSRDEGKVEFLGPAAVRTPQSHIICDAPVASWTSRMKAALLDIGLMALPCTVGTGLLRYLGGEISFDKHSLLFFLMALATVPLLYKLLWAFAGCDTIGMRRAGLQLVNFDGNPPSRKRRYLRLFGSLLSFLAAGIGLVWSLVDEDRLTWHDHISGTFPTIASED